jgi:hypothetical protein
MARRDQMPDRASARGLRRRPPPCACLNALVSFGFCGMPFPWSTSVPLFDGVWRGKQRSTLDGRACPMARCVTIDPSAGEINNSDPAHRGIRSSGPRAGNVIWHLSLQRRARDLWKVRSRDNLPRRLARTRVEPRAGSFAKASNLEVEPISFNVLDWDCGRHPSATACRLGGEDQIIYCPPLMVSVEPVMKPDSSETRNTTQRATSSGSPRRRTGMSGRIDFSKTSFGTALTMSVAI